MYVWVFQLLLLIKNIPGEMWVNQRYFTQHNFKEMWPSLIQTSRLPVEYNSTTYDYTGRYLQSCPHCLVWEDTLTNNQEGRSLYIFSELKPNFSTFTKILFTLQFFTYIFPTSTAKDGSLEESHVETFKKQASCIGLPAEIYVPGTASKALPSP